MKTIDQFKVGDKVIAPMSGTILEIREFKDKVVDVNRKRKIRVKKAVAVCLNIKTNQIQTITSGTLTDAATKFMYYD